MSAPPDLPGVRHTWVRARDLDVHVATAGPEPAAGGPTPVVLVHGWPQHWWCWHDVFGPLAADRPVLAVDLRGAGWTTATRHGYRKHALAGDLLATLDALGLEHVDLVGHDWGGMVALLAAVARPERVRRVAGVAIAAPWSQVALTPRTLVDFLYQPLFASPLGPPLQRGLRGRSALELVFAVAAAPGRRPARADVAPYLARFADRARARAGSAMYRTFLREELPAIRRGTYSAGPPDGVPVLLLPGEHDPVLRPALVGAAADRDRVRVEPIPGAGHWVPEEAPDVLVERLRAFLG